MRISNSFSEGEVQVLEFILQTLLRGGTPTMAVRNKDFASLYRKVMTMKKRMHAPERPAPEKSSVGTIAAATRVQTSDAHDEHDDEHEDDAAVG